jgi:hypothetical protein
MLAAFIANKRAGKAWKTRKTRKQLPHEAIYEIIAVREETRKAEVQNLR